MKKMLLPYIIYLIIINYVSGVLIGNYLEMIDKQADVHYHKNFSQAEVHKDDVGRQNMRLMGLVLTSIALLFLFFFSSLEMGQLKADGMGYFNDVWNCIDMSSALINLSFSG